MNEEWRSIRGYTGMYEVSNMGRVRSLDRVVVRSDGQPRKYKGRILKQNPDTSGYPMVNLHKNNSGKSWKVHALVMQAFGSKKPSPRHQCCHNDGDQSNNILSNLRWDTPKNNCLDKQIHGTQNQGSKHARAVLTEGDVKEIIRLLPTVRDSELSKLFCVNQSSIRHIRLGLGWKHVSREV